MCPTTIDNSSKNY